MNHTPIILWLGSIASNSVFLFIPHQNEFRLAGSLLLILGWVIVFSEMKR